MNTKPILFNTDMVRALQNGTKTVTRRVVKPQPEERLTAGKDALKLLAAACAPYRPGDILYVRETWQEVYETEHDVDGSKRTVNIRDIISNFDDIPKVEAGISHDCATASMKPRMKYYVFKASDISYTDPESGLLWRPSIHMPREAARIFLRVTDVRVERLQDIPIYDIVFEGFRRQRDFIALWNSTIKPKERALFGWEFNPWVWVIEFERISREEAMQIGS